MNEVETLFSFHLNNLDTYLNKGNHKLALEYINSFNLDFNIDMIKINHPDMYFRYYFNKSIILERNGFLNEALTLVEGILNFVKFKNNNFYETKFIIRKANIYFLLGNLDLSLDICHKCELLIKKNDNLIADEKNELIFSLNKLMGLIHWRFGDFDKALFLFNHCLKLGTTIQNILENAKILNNIGLIYWNRGELNQSLEYFNESLTIFKNLENLEALAILYGNIGRINIQKGHFRFAKKFLLKGLEVTKNLNIISDTSWILFELIYLSYLIDEIEDFNTFFKELELLINRNEEKRVKIEYQLAKALYLKRSNNVVEQEESQIILKNLINSEIVNQRLTLIAYNTLCEILLTNLLNSDENLNIEELKNLIEHMFQIAEKQHSATLLIEHIILKSKLYLIEGNFDKVTDLLNRGFKLVEEKQLFGYKNKLNIERKLLESQMAQIKTKMTFEVPFKSRIEQSQILEYITSVKKLKAKEGVLDF